MKQRHGTLSRRSDLPMQGRLRGVITVVQEDRFRLQDDVGRGYLLTLGRGNGVGMRKLHAWCDQQITLEVEYRGIPDLGAVATRIAER